MDKITESDEQARRPELVLLAGESLVLGAILMAATITVGPALVTLPRELWFGAGVAVLMLVIAPVNMLLARLANRRFGVFRMAGTVVAAGVVATVMYRILT